MSGWNLTLETQNFRFTPEKVNIPNVANEGHAHVYVNGEKLTRLYAKHYHLSNFPVGEHDISVTLNANDHLALALNQQTISAKATITQEAMKMPMKMRNGEMGIDITDNKNDGKSKGEKAEEKEGTQAIDHRMHKNMQMKQGTQKTKSE